MVKGMKDPKVHFTNREKLNLLRVEHFTSSNFVVNTLNKLSGSLVFFTALKNLSSFKRHVCLKSVFECVLVSRFFLVFLIGQTLVLLNLELLHLLRVKR